MFEIAPHWLAVALAVVFLLEVALFWVATALADVPPLGWGKIFLVVLAVTVFSGGAAAALYVISTAYAETGSTGWTSAAVRAPLAAENRSAVLIGLALAAAATCAVPAVLYPMLLSVSVRRGMWISVLQVLLRAFLYVLIVSVAMVALAGLQIWSGTDARSEAPAAVGRP